MKASSKSLCGRIILILIIANSFILEFGVKEISNIFSFLKEESTDQVIMEYACKNKIFIKSSGIYSYTYNDSHTFIYFGGSYFIVHPKK